MSAPPQDDGNRAPVDRLSVNALPDSGPVTTDLAVPAIALAVGAHPDDIEFGCGATLAKWAAAGCQVHHLVLTDGSKGSWNPDRDEAALVATRQGEQREASRRLGGSGVVFMGWPDGELRNGVREQWEVCRQIRTIRPDVVLGHDPWRRYQLHPDHRHAGYLLIDATVAARDPLFFPDQEEQSHRPSFLLLWEADVPNHVESAGHHADDKVHALLAHESQFESTMRIPSVQGAGRLPLAACLGAEPTRDTAVADFRRRVMAQLQEHGRLAGITLGECFHLVSDI